MIQKKRPVSTVSIKAIDDSLPVPACRINTSPFKSCYNFSGYSFQEPPVVDSTKIPPQAHCNSHKVTSPESSAVGPEIIDLTTKSPDKAQRPQLEALFAASDFAGPSKPPKKSPKPLVEPKPGNPTMLTSIYYSSI